MRRLNRKATRKTLPETITDLQAKIKEEFGDKQDISFKIYEKEQDKVVVLHLAAIIDEVKLDNFLLRPLLATDTTWTTKELLNTLPMNSGEEITDLKSLLEALIYGKAIVYVEKEKKAIGYVLANIEERAIQKAETESIIIGPQVAFTESIHSNLNLLRWRLKTTDLVMEKFTLGSRIPTEVRLVYLGSLANQTDVETMRQRIEDIVIDDIEDIHTFKRYVDDSTSTIFPQFVTTELLDRTSYAIANGKLAVLVDESPSALIAPTTFFSFFESTEDMYMRWNTGSFLRLLRYFAVFVSTLLTPMYVAAATFHYELIPTELLISIGQSRAQVPFPPIFEVLLLEFIIEMLREAGARLPTKVGQTVGIVGGIVVGTAAVQAGITSSILIIFIALSALASFTTPIYLMATSLRLLRYPFVILAGVFGIMGIVFGVSFVFIHLLKIKSLGRPFLSPLYPLRLSDFNRVFYRGAPQSIASRFESYRLKDKFHTDKVKVKQKKDIDE